MPIANTSARNRSGVRTTPTRRDVASGGLAHFSTSCASSGLYDSSLIVISSDHGVALPPEGFTGDRDVFGGPLSEISGSALALLVVKPPRATGPVRISEAPSAISDIPATIVDTLGLKNPFHGHVGA